jgi:hypothetical protein
VLRNLLNISNSYRCVAWNVTETSSGPHDILAVCLDYIVHLSCETHLYTASAPKDLNTVTSTYFSENLPPQDSISEKHLYAVLDYDTIHNLNSVVFSQHL